LSLLGANWVPYTKVEKLSNVETQVSRSSRVSSVHGRKFSVHAFQHDKLDESFADEICALVLPGLKPSVALQMGT
jgi:hypothetical protein